MRKNILVLLGVLVMGAGLALAISGATPTQVSQTRWAGDAASSQTTEGGNISVVNVSGTALTDKWAAYSGNVSGRITLDDNGAGAAVFNWTWTPSTGGEVCVSTNSAYDFTAATTAAAAGIDTAWGFTATDADSAANTYTSTCGTALTFAQSSVAGTTAAADLQGFSSFLSCAVDDTGAAETNYAFCTQVQSAGTNYNNQSAHYELMVPTTAGPSATETYFFYLELD
ncbi:MAG: hypothetical protein AB1529_05635 [Candidatus Micrarchaeota archaeon]